MPTGRSFAPSVFLNASVGNMARKAKKIVTKRRTAKSKLVDTRDLCKDLVAIAGFLEDRRTAMKIYKAVRELQLLDLAAKNLPR